MCGLGPSNSTSQEFIHQIYSIGMTVQNTQAHLVVVNMSISGAIV